GIPCWRQPSAVSFRLLADDLCSVPASLAAVPHILSRVTVTLRAVSERKPHKPRDIPGCLQQIQNCPDQPNQANSPFLRPQRHQTRPCLLRRTQPLVTTWSAGVTRDGDATGAAPFTWRQNGTLSLRGGTGGRLSAIIPQSCQ
ncbi:hypothetical protein CMEL01_01876, partial [Colletotrichum melonis]